ncbi:GNAT family N-acetyltransferase [Patulibacter sp.]|uniref:GNAT family N-acetyltransferase n=1 Tax=Patulibacter sp. TaxID=1912859 RepID=UPI00271BBBBC|nr:GNAT family N-acetyltransferase [Patulibacter sp.]MDO9410176.1 GNAT family N-acetyltransferase [Patulibacter sp.]
MTGTPTTEPVALHWVRSAGELRAALALRLRVFCDEQGVPREIEVDEYDDVARHAVAVSPDGRVVGTMRLVPVGTMVKVGRVAVDREWRGRGIASALLEKGMEYAQGIRAEELRLAAQVAAIDLYRKAGYRPVGQPFEEAGIEHVWMVREVVPVRRGGLSGIARAVGRVRSAVVPGGTDAAPVAGDAPADPHDRA